MDDLPLTPTSQVLIWIPSPISLSDSTAENNVSVIKRGHLRPPGDRYRVSQNEHDTSISISLTDVFVQDMGCSAAQCNPCNFYHASAIFTMFIVHRVSERARIKEQDIKWERR